jgi:hypothetical protein
LPIKFIHAVAMAVVMVTIVGMVVIMVVIEATMGAIEGITEHIMDVMDAMAIIIFIVDGPGTEIMLIGGGELAWHGHMASIKIEDMSIHAKQDSGAFTTHSHTM